MGAPKDTAKLCDKLTKDFRQAMDFIGKKKVVLGLSGGVDSALAGALMARAMGASNVIPVFMPYKTTNPSSKTDAEAVATKFDLKMEVFDISEPADAFFKDTPDADFLRRGNVMARMRMVTLFDRAAKENAIVGGTSNKTEIILGYGTWYGDTASSINIIGSLYKKQVYELSEYLEIPESVIIKKPSADLWEGQTDEDELGFSYPIADKFLYAFFNEKKDRIELEKEFGAELTNKIIKRAATNSFKRNMPLVIGAPSSFFRDIDKRISDFVMNDIM